MRTRHLLIGTAVLLAIALRGAIALANGSLTAVAHGPAGLRIEAKTSKIEFSSDESTLTFTAAIARLETGIDLRDRHLRQMLAADAFPSVVLRVPRSAVALPGEREPSEGVAQGELTLRGSSRPVAVHYRAEVLGASVTRVRGFFKLDLRDFEVAPPSYLRLAVSPQVEIEAELILTGRDHPGADAVAPLVGIDRGSHP